MRAVVLEHPRISSEKRFNDIANTPLWSCLMGGYGAAALEGSGLDVKFVDHAFLGATFEATTEEILSLAPDLLAVNAVYFWEHSNKLFDFFTNLKRRGFAGHLSLFGFFPSLVYGDILKMVTAVDSIAVGEFEHTLVELSNAIANKRSLKEIEGLATRGEGATVLLVSRTPDYDLDRFHFPRRNPGASTATILGSRGCYNNCSFCLVPTFDTQKRGWRGRSPLNIFREMEILVAEGVRDFYFADPNFIGPGKKGRARTLQLLELLRPLNITFGMETRPNDLDDEILGHLVGAGMTSLLMGIESGSANILRHIRKSSTTSVGAEAIQLCRDHGVDPEIGFLMFVTDATLPDLRENILFLKSNGLLDRLERTANLLSHKQIVMAGTTGYGEYEKQGRLEKSGVFGFEGEVRFVDKKVEWISELVIFACSMVLRAMSEEHSPIFWRNTVSPVFGATNQYLVSLFDALLAEAETARTLDDIIFRQQEIRKEILTLLTT
ncbi:MAG: B12-binding domain-containing radical SAM protein [Desulforhopalus sp.]